MLVPENTVLIIVDVQGKLAGLMYEREALIDNLRKMIRGSQILKIPILWVEQNPRGLGPTVPEVSELMPDLHPISKLTFSCCGSRAFMKKFVSLERRQVLIAGIETHVCIYQTVMDLLDLDYEIQVVVDAVSSRTEENKEVALKKIEHLGAGMTTAETALFELLKVAEGPKFKEILKIMK